MKFLLVIIKSRFICSEWHCIKCQSGKAIIIRIVDKMKKNKNIFLRLVVKVVQIFFFVDTTVELVPSLIAQLFYILLGVVVKTI